MIRDAMEAQIRRYAMLLGGETVCVALSGGADSVALLLGLLGLREAYHLTVTAVHVHHGLRGAESDRDAQFCAALCEKLQVPLTTEHCDVKGYAAAHGCSMEEAGRACRYAVFDGIPADKIATAHTASDNVETILYHLTRGTALPGLCGIPPVRGRLIRPLLTISRAEILAFLSSESASYVTDSSNLCDDYTRNRFRHHVVPVLRQQNAGLEQTITGMVRILEAENAYLAEAAEAAYQSCLQPDGSLHGLSVHPVALRRRCIVRFLQGGGIAVSAPLVEAAMTMLETGGKRNLTADVYLLAKQGTLKLEHRVQPFVLAETPMRIGEQVLIPGKQCNVEVLTNGQNVHSMFANSVIDYDKIKGAAFFRSYREGDVIALAGRQHTARVRKLLQAQIPKEERPFLHYLADDAGLVWIERIGVASRVQVTDAAKRIVRLTVTAVKNKDKE